MSDRRESAEVGWALLWAVIGMIFGAAFGGYGSADTLDELCAALAEERGAQTVVFQHHDCFDVLKEKQ